VVVGLATPTRRLLHLVIAWLAYFIGSALAFVPTIVIVTAVLESSAVLMGVAAMSMPLLTLLMYSLMKPFVAADAVTVGDDGVWITSGRKKRFVPRTQISGLFRNAFGQPYGFELRDGTKIALVGVAMDVERRNAVLELANARLGGTPEAVDRGAAFARDGRSVAEWRAAIARVLEDPGYRSAGLTSEQTEAVLRNPLASPEQRIGAAMAIRIAGDPPDRIRVAAEAAADPDVREALEAVADDGDPGRLERVLRRLG
jgi:hypothetical protein